MQKISNNTFRTILNTEKYDFDIDYKSKMMFIGSCFTENIGGILKKAKFNIDINPFGIIYNPLSVKNALDNIIKKRIFSENDLFYFNERWNSFMHHSVFSDINIAETLKSINDRISRANENIESNDFLFISFGTAWVYKYIETGIVVSNCHKIPGKEFKKDIIEPKDIIKSYVLLYKDLRKINPKSKIVFTISPVRHLKDGFAENSLSKSILRYAISEIVDACKDSYYFPAYEIQTDDLRDYRFYNSDMVHPNETAIDYIFNFFSKSFFSDETKQIFNKIEKINRSLEHRPFNTKAEEFIRFVRNTQNEIETLYAKYNFLNFKEELSYLKEIIK